MLFSGGRGSQVLSKQLINHPQVELALAINGYDDGASTGEVRRMLGDSLGPSDFRKNASRLAREMQSCNSELIELLDLRFPLGCSIGEALSAFHLVSGQITPMEAPTEFHKTLLSLLAKIDDPARLRLSLRLRRFADELSSAAQTFSFSDCSLGNLAFAGCFLQMGRDFNAAITDYCALLSLDGGLIENVTDGTNAFLVAIDRDHRLLASEAEIVDANRRNHIKDIYLIDRPLTEEEKTTLGPASIEEMTKFLEFRTRRPAANARLLERISEADLIIYSPGTQHSSLFPSYLTPGIGVAIAQNLTAIKLLITNLQEDAEIPDSSAVDIIEKATYYLKERDKQQIPTPCLITHYLINDRRQEPRKTSYVPLGPLESLEDPRLVRIGDYEAGFTGRHDAAKVLTPFIETILQRGERRRVAVWLLETDSLNKISQTILEMMRGGISDLPLSVSVFYHSRESFAPAFTCLLPFTVENVAASSGNQTQAFVNGLAGRNFDYVILFDSSGMYQGEDLVNLASLLWRQRPPHQPQHLDAVWGSRRLSVKDIHESYKLRYRHNIILGAISYLGSHLLSFVYLMLYGRYISDTLSGVRAIGTSYLRAAPLDLLHPCFNHRLLSLLLRDRAEIYETPVQFFSLSPEKVRRTTVLDGLRSLLTIVWRRFISQKAPSNLDESMEDSELRGFPEHALAERKKAG